MEGLAEEARNLSTLLDLFADFSISKFNRVKSALGTPIGRLPMQYSGLSLRRGVFERRAAGTAAFGTLCNSHILSLSFQVANGNWKDTRRFDEDGYGPGQSQGMSMVSLGHGM